jgi:DNA-binding NtrC family response regulator
MPMDWHCSDSNAGGIQLVIDHERPTSPRQAPQSVLPGSGDLSHEQLLLGVSTVNTAARPLLYLKSPDADDAVPLSALQQRWDVHVASHANDCRGLIQQQAFHVGLVDLGGCGQDSRAIHHQAQRLHDLWDADVHIKWVGLISDTANSLGQVSRFIATHLYEYHSLPADVERLLVTLGHAYGMAQVARSQREPRADDAMQFGMVGQSRTMCSLFEAIRKVATIDLNVMIRGDSGTGKELTAQAIHRLSRRSDGPFVAVNCGALPKELIHAELFGHEKGSFTGADRRRVGRIEAAQGGTLFLDEIGDLPLDLQANLLRFLQEKTIDRVGSSTPITVDVRVIAATHVNLERAVEQGRFREDLYYRLNVLHLDIPPLRERGEDIALLANYLLKQSAKTVPSNVKGFSQQALHAINAHPWPGNVREMVNRIQRAVLMCEGKLIGPRDLGLDQDTPHSTMFTLAQARSMAEKEAIESTLKAVRNNVSKAARRLDISRVTLYRLLEQHSIDWQRRSTRA